MLNLRKCTALWWNDPGSLTVEELELLNQAFKKGLVPLGDEYGDHNPRWVEWKKEVELEIENRLRP